jgi:O-6-methylguanine DNA methyltransferase
MEIVHTTRLDSPIGPCRVASTERGLAFLELPRASGRGFGGWLRRSAPGAECVEDFEENRVAVRQILEYLEGKRTAFELPLDLRGTAFQRQVWEATLEIPYGESRSYGEIAGTIGRPRSIRAVGTALGANPVALVVPCHRVIAADGRLGGFSGGLDLKARLLAMERGRPAQGRLL